MDKKHRKEKWPRVGEMEHVLEARPQQKSQPVLNEKDRAILDDVENIIWNPDRLKKLKDNGKTGQAK